MRTLVDFATFINGAHSGPSLRSEPMSAWGYPWHNSIDADRAAFSHGQATGRSAPRLLRIIRRYPRHPPAARAVNLTTQGGKIHYETR